MKHFGIFNTSGEVETAISQSAITEPYVVMVSGDVYYNTVGESGMTGCWIEDSQGNIYSGELSNDIYTFNYNKPTGATWTLYYNGQVVTASSFYAEKRYTCEEYYPGGVDTAEVVEETGYTVQNINIGTEDSWSDSVVGFSLGLYLSNMEVSCSLEGGDCDDYVDCRWAEEGQEKCTCEGRYWWGDDCHDEPEPEPSESDPCSDYEEGSQEKCECEGRYWWGDECHDEPEASE